MPTIYYYSSPLGPITLHWSEVGLQQLRFDQASAEAASSGSSLPIRYSSDLDQYFSGQPSTFDWTLDLTGTPFQRSVWNAVAAIGYGQISTYKEIGEQIGSQGWQAVGQAVGANPVPIIIPCHRVLAATGIGGYSGGLGRKTFLLQLEQSPSGLTDLT